MLAPALPLASSGYYRSLAGRTVLQLIPTFDDGEVERATLGVAEALAQIGARALVACESGSLIGELQAKGGVWMPLSFSTQSPMALARNVTALAKLCREEGVAVVHARSRVAAWMGLAAAKITRLPLATTYHGDYAAGSSTQQLYNSALVRSDAVIAPSQFAADEIDRLYPFARGKVRVVCRGVDFSRFQPQAVAPERVAALRESWAATRGERIVPIFGGIAARNGHAVFVEAAQRLLAGGLADTLFLIAGEPEDAGFARDLAARLVRAPHAAIRIVRTPEDRAAAYLAAAAVVAPATEAEASGASAIEAQAMGVPAVVTDVGAHAETVLASPQAVGQRRTGWRIPAGNALALARAIVQALSLGASARALLSERARAHALGRFSLEHMVAATMDVYAALTEPGGR
jgi:glycosyltransferase involved in cell wall biosynthesis